MSRNFILFVVIMVIGSILFLLDKNIFASDERVDMPPAFDGSTDSKLRFDYCKGEDAMNTWGEWKGGPREVCKKLKSKQWKDIKEVWGGQGPLITIYRWVFDCPEDALLFPESGMVTASLLFPGWSNTRDIGDKTCWIGPDIVLFTKGKTLVRIEVNPGNLGKEYTRRIAEVVAKKL